MLINTYDRQEKICDTIEITDTYLFIIWKYLCCHDTFFVLRIKNRFLYVDTAVLADKFCVCKLSTQF